MLRLGRIPSWLQPGELSRTCFRPQEVRSGINHGAVATQGINHGAVATRGGGGAFAPLGFGLPPPPLGYAENSILYVTI